MASQLVPVFAGEIAGTSVQLVNARTLHNFLEVGRRFATWIVERIDEYGFVQDQDFLISQNGETKIGRGGDRRSKDYHITIDMAKELAMVERNDKGREVRRYFIECERRLREGTSCALKELPSPTLTASDQQTLSEIVDHRARECAHIGKAKAEIWSRLHRKFRIARYQQLPREQLSAAITYVMQMDLKAEAVPEMPVPEKATYREIADYTYAREQMSSLYDWSRRALPPRVQDEVYDVLKELDRSLVRGWTEIDESIICLVKAMGMLRRWKRAH